MSLLEMTLKSQPEYNHPRRSNMRSDTRTEQYNRNTSEGRLAKAIERQTSKLPSDTFLWTAVGAIGVSLALQIMGKRETSNFIGQWAPTVLILGLYNKLVKVAGSDREDQFAEDFNEAA